MARQDQPAVSPQRSSGRRRQDTRPRRPRPAAALRRTQCCLSKEGAPLLGPGEPHENVGWRHAARDSVPRPGQRRVRPGLLAEASGAWADLVRLVAVAATPVMSGVCARGAAPCTHSRRLRQTPAAARRGWKSRAKTIGGIGGCLRVPQTRLRSRTQLVCANSAANGY